LSEHYSISDLATEFGITPRTIRFYEDHNLLAPERDGQRRIYSRRDRGRLAWVLRAKRVGFSLSEIADMLDLYDLDDDRAQQRHVTLEMCRKQLQDLESQRHDLDATIDELSSFCDLLEKLEAGQDPASLKPSFPSFFTEPRP
jgi:DNA-binding transcriptional MerR regulator